MAREYLYNQLIQRSWIVPLIEDTNITKYATFFQQPSVIGEQHIITPEGFPIQFITTNDFQAVESSSRKILWTKSSLEFTSGEVDPTGVTLILRRWSPEHGLQALDPFTGCELWNQKTGGLIRKMSFSPDGRRIAVLSQDGHVTILNTSDGTVPFETYCAGPDVFDVAFSPDCSELFLAKKGCVLICSILQTAVELPVKPFGVPLLAVDVSSDNTRLAMLSSISENNISLEVRNAKTLSLLSRTELCDGIPYLVTFSQDGNYVAVGGGNATNLNIFQINGTNVPIRTFFTPMPKHLSNIVPVLDGFVVCEDSDYSKDEKYTPRLLLWQATKPNELQNITLEGLKPISISCTKNYLYILTTSAVVILDATTRKEIKRFSTSGFFESIVCSEDGCFVLSTRLTRQAVAFDKNGQQLFKTALYSESGILPTAISSDGYYCAVAVSANGVQVFETKTGTPVTSVFNMPEKIENLKFDGKTSSLRLFVCGGPDMYNLRPNSAYYAIINPVKNRLVRLRNGLSEKQSKIHNIGNNALLLSGLNCSVAYLLQRENLSEELPQDGFSELCDSLAGRCVLDNGISIPHQIPLLQTTLQGKWKNFQNEVKQHPRHRHISFNSDIPLVEVFKVLESGYFNEYDLGLSIDPSNESILASYWIGFARKILEERYKHQHPESNQDLHFASYSTERWAHEIFNDPQTRFFCNVWTKRLLELYPNSKLAKHEREVYLNHTQSPSPKQFDSNATKTEWEQFCSDSNADPINNPHICKVAETYSKDATTFSEFINSLKILLVKKLKSSDIDYMQILSLVNFLGQEIEVWAHAIPNGDAINSQLLEDLIVTVQTCKPSSMAQLLECYLQLSLAESYILQHNLSKAQICITKAQQTDDLILKSMLPVYEFYLTLAQGDGNAAAKLLNTFLANYKSTYGAEVHDAIARQTWLFLAYLKQSGLNFGDFTPIFDKMSEQYFTGVEIKVSSDGEASKMGWQDGDHLMKLDGVDILNERHLITLFARRRLKNEKTEFVLKRGTKTFISYSSAPLLGIFY